MSEHQRMQPDERALLLSLRPRFAELVLAGAKSVELRRVRPNVPSGAVALIYATSPTCAMVGVAAVMAVDVDNRERIWRQHGEHTGITRREFDEYFEGSLDAVAITLSAVRRLRRPVGLPQLRQGRDWFRPPQSFRYLTPEQTASLGVV
jgi:predicted transcriptional regulator